jgi:hypothetical protein
MVETLPYAEVCHALKGNNMAGKVRVIRDYCTMGTVLKLIYVCTAHSLQHSAHTK